MNNAQRCQFWGLPQHFCPQTDGFHQQQHVSNMFLCVIMFSVLRANDTVVTEVAIFFNPCFCQLGRGIDKCIQKMLALIMVIGLSLMRNNVLPHGVRACYT